MKKLVMLAREITKMEIEMGIGEERSSTRLSPIFKTLSLNLPIRNGKLYKPTIPINPREGMPILQMPLEFIPFDESLLFGTPSINEKSRSLEVQPTKAITDPGKGTGTPFIAAAIGSKDDDILILTPCDQYMSSAVTRAVKTILGRMEKNGFSCGTVLTTGTRNPAFSYIKVKGERAVEFMLKGTIPREDMIGDTMIVCCRVDYLKKQIMEMKDATIEKLKGMYPYKEKDLQEIQQTLKRMSGLLESCKTPEEFLKRSTFCDFSKVIHRLLITDMTFATVEYQKEWDDLGDWQKVYRSLIFPKDGNGNVIFSRKELISYTNCSNSVIANFTENKVIVNGLKDRIFAIGERGAIDIPLALEPKEFKKEVVKIQM